MSRSFVHVGQLGRVVFGAGTASRLGDELEALGVSRAAIVTTPGQAKLGADFSIHAGQRSAGVLPLAVMHVPVEVAAEAVTRAIGMGADGLVAVGGGSAIGLARALPMQSACPFWLGDDAGGRHHRCRRKAHGKG